jgi:hypothetical protein
LTVTRRMLEALAVHRPSPAMIVALLALFVALGGSSYAALRIGSPQIRNDSVLSADRTTTRCAASTCTGTR